MKIVNQACRIVQYLKLRYRLWKFDYFLWICRPKLLSAVFVIGLIATLLSEKSIIDYKFDVMDPKSDALESVALAVEQSPDLWLKQLEAKKGTLSEYEYKLQYEQYRFFARNAPSLANSIRDEKFRTVIKDSAKLTAEQTAQLAAGKIAGKGADYIGSRLGGKISVVGANLAEKGYTAAGRIFSKGANTMIWSGEKVGEASSNLAWELAQGSKGKTSMPPVKELAMASPEFKALFDLIEKATEQNPDKLMTAALHQAIFTVGLERDEELYPDNEYRTDVMSVAKRFIKMTQAGGSSTSMWKDVNALAVWLAGKAGRSLPEEEKTGSAIENIFTKDDFPIPPGDLILTWGDITLYSQEKGSQKLLVTYDKTEETVWRKVKLSDGTTRIDTTTTYLAKAALYVYVFESESLAKKYFESDVRSQSKYLKTQSRAKVLEDEDTRFVFTTGYYSYGMSHTDFDYDLERYILYKNSFIQVQGMSKGEADANSYCNYLEEQAKTLVDHKGYLGKKP